MLVLAYEWPSFICSRPITIQYRQLWYHSFKTFAINPVILISQCNEIMKTIILCSSPRWFFLTLINGTYLVSCLEWKSGKTLISNKMRKIPYLRVFPHSGVPVIVQWTLVIVTSVLSSILFTNMRFLLLPESMIFSFITYNWYPMLYLTIYLTSWLEWKRGKTLISNKIRKNPYLWIWKNIQSD